MTSTETRQFRVLGTTEDVTTCQLCGREDLKGTIALAPLDADGNQDGETVYYGSDCGARAAGWGRNGAARMRKEAASADYRAAQLAEIIAERRERYGRALITLANEAAAGRHAIDEIMQIRRTFRQMGGMDVLGKFPAWVAYVAETGDLGS